MKLTTSRGNEYNVDFIDTTSNPDNVVLRLPDHRKLPAIAEEFDGLEWLKRESANQGNKIYTGYNVLVGITRNQATGTVLLVLDKEVNTNG